MSDLDGRGVRTGRRGVVGRGSAETSCNVERALAVVGAKWALVILHDLMDGPKRFGELQRLIPSASAKMLTERLRDLERHGLVDRTVFAEVPPRVIYTLTETGRTLWPIVDSLDRWGKRLSDVEDRTPPVRHSKTPTGTPPSAHRPVR